MDFTYKPRDEEDAAYTEGQAAYDQTVKRGDNPYQREVLREARFTGWDDRQYDEMKEGGK